MSRALPVTDRARLRDYFLRDPGLHIYELGDLDDFFWPNTRWYGLGDLEAVVLLYAAPALPVLLAIGDPGPLRELLAEVRDELPARFYGHLTPGVVGALAPRYRSEPHGSCVKMALADRSRLGTVDTSHVSELGPGDREEIEAFLARCYPENWFDPRMLATGCYVGVRERGLIAVGGVHVYSPTQRVAALGNIAVAPDQRGRGLGTAITARICQRLLGEVDDIGLNVRAGNEVAIACYARLGFVEVGRFEEHVLDRP